MLKRDSMDKVHEGRVEMTYPMTPGRWLDTEPKLIDVVRVRLSCGGGVGGSQWFEYLVNTTLDDIAKADRFMRVKNMDGKQVLVNVNFIVDAKPYKIAVARYHSDNPNYTKGDYFVRYLLDPNATAVLVGRY